MSVDNFKAEVAQFARPTLFRVSAPAVLDRKLQFLAKGAQLPSSQLGIIEVPYLGRKIKIAGDRVFVEWTLTIQQDETFTIRKQLEDWSNSINDHVLNVGPAAAEDYKYDMIVEQLGNDESVIASYKLVGCFPQEIGSVELAFDSNDTVMEYSVTIAYDYWTRIQ